jgi:hypothetical protein
MLDPQKSTKPKTKKKKWKIDPYASTKPKNPIHLSLLKNDLDLQ